MHRLCLIILAEFELFCSGGVSRSLGGGSLNSSAVSGSSLNNGGVGNDGGVSSYRVGSSSVVVFLVTAGYHGSCEKNCER